MLRPSLLSFFLRRHGREALLLAVLTFGLALAEAWAR
jgi:hypothetical protein